MHGRVKSRHREQSSHSEFLSRIIITFRIDDRVRRVSGWDARPLLVSRSPRARTFLRFLSPFGNFVLPFSKKNSVRTISRARSFVAMFFHRRVPPRSASSLSRFRTLLCAPFPSFSHSGVVSFPEFRASNSLNHIFDVFSYALCFYYFLPFSRHFHRDEGHSLASVPFAAAAFPTAINQNCENQNAAKTCVE